MNKFLTFLFFSPIITCNFLSGMDSSISLDQQTYQIFSNMFKFNMIELIVKRHNILTKGSHKAKIVGDFFYQTNEIDPRTRNEDLERLKTCDKGKKFLGFKTFKVVAVNGQPTQNYYRELETLPIDDAVKKVLLDEKLTLTCESCASNPFGTVVHVEYLPNT